MLTKTAVTQKRTLLRFSTDVAPNGTRQCAHQVPGATQVWRCREVPIILYWHRDGSTCWRPTLSKRRSCSAGYDAQREGKSDRSTWSDYAMSRIVRGAVCSCCPCTPTLPHTRTNEGGGGMRVRHDSGTCGAGAVRSSTLHVSRIPRPSTYQRELKQYRRSYI